MDDKRVGIIAELDQLQAFLRDLAPVLAKFQQSLYNQGMTRAEATSVVRSLLHAMYREANRG